MKKWTAMAALALGASLGTSTVMAANEEQAEMAAGLIQMAASMNEIAIECKHLSAAEVGEAKTQQKLAAVRDMQLSAEQYDKMYFAAQADFKKQWSAMPAANKKQTCDQMKSIPKSPQFN
ncbi:hypothetical protein E9531_12900 [Lampropedia puyangensis]|uniref:Uncharacterized protein n=1 Tax=Lampropedia puyangensis TaxID=1330072 RepID=A0A4S8EYF0_9BURK|nr:hypothetical protein [Lampropedia puyangensis]THT99290.1 hypothetical protein E9531_12900 [Lampropedia puyangensis]